MQVPKRMKQELSLEPEGTEMQSLESISLLTQQFEAISSNSYKVIKIYF